MTNKLEKQFFDTFGIEPIEIPSREYDSDGEICSYYVEYPQITDRILLELICIANREDVYIELVGTDVETMKNNLLENFIHFKRIIPKHQVRTLFEEG